MRRESLCTECPGLPLGGNLESFVQVSCRARAGPSGPSRNGRWADCSFQHFESRPWLQRMSFPTWWLTDCPLGGLHSALDPQHWRQRCQVRWLLPGTCCAEEFPAVSIELNGRRFHSDVSPCCELLLSSRQGHPPGLPRPPPQGTCGQGLPPELSTWSPGAHLIRETSQGVPAGQVGPWNPGRDGRSGLACRSRH